MRGTKCEGRGSTVNERGEGDGNDYPLTGDINGIQIFYNIYLYTLKDIMRGSVATDPEDIYIFYMI